MDRICFCFSAEPLSEGDASTVHAKNFERYLANSNQFQVTLCEAPWASCSACCWCFFGGCPLTFPCAQLSLRYKALNHVAPGSGWANYVLCQGYFPACLCFQPGNCGEKECPRMCMCCEAYCCPGFAMSSTRFLVMDAYALTVDPCDNRMVRANNCIQLLACVCHIAALFDKNLRDCAQLVDVLADVVFWSMSGCMAAQVANEIKYREEQSLPSDYQSFEGNAYDGRQRPYSDNEEPPLSLPTTVESETTVAYAQPATYNPIPVSTAVAAPVRASQPAARASAPPYTGAPTTIELMDR